MALHRVPSLKRLLPLLRFAESRHGFTHREVNLGTFASKPRVSKKLATTNRGAIKLALQFGDTLVCVRHRVDAQARFRYTTVELLIEKVEMQPRQSRMVSIRVHPDEFGLRTVVRAAGAVCDSRTGLWHMPKRVATVLRLTNRIVSSK